MIAAPLEHLERYLPIHGGFAAAAEFIRTANLAALAPGRHAIDGDRLYVSIDHKDGRGREGATLEAHRRYIDVQVTLSGREEIGWRPLAACTQPDGVFSTERDIGFFLDRPDVWIAVPPGIFAIFFPEDAHAPLAGHGPLRKAIVKVLAGSLDGEAKASPYALR
jgi:YhcH/YjgK/YiaL family protein